MVKYGIIEISLFYVNEYFTFHVSGKKLKRTATTFYLI
jgi:hypothetical protein